MTGHYRHIVTAGCHSLAGTLTYQHELCSFQSSSSKYLEYISQLVEVYLELLLLSQDLACGLRDCNSHALQMLCLPDQLHHGLVKVDQHLPCNSS